MILSFAKNAIGLLFILSLWAGCSSGSGETAKKDDIDQIRKNEEENSVARGGYLVLAAGCNDCHSPKIMTAQGPIPDTTRILSGHPANMPTPAFYKEALSPGNWVQMGPDLTTFVGPWGISYAANLTPDTATGIGAWTEEVFIRALKTGKHMGQQNGRPILPPMPWNAMSRIKDDDLKAIYAYLRSLPGINNRVPQPLSPPDAQKLAK